MFVDFNAYLQNKKIKLGKGSRSFEEFIKRKSILYISKGDQTNFLNGYFETSHGEKIVCTHLAYYMLTHPKDYASLSRTTDISKIPQLYNDYCGTSCLESNRAFYRIFLLKEFGSQLYELAQSLSKREHTLNLLFASTNHRMSIILRLKNKDNFRYYVVKFYDPNHTTAHRRIVCKSRKHIKGIGINFCLNKQEEKSYFSASEICVIFPISAASLEEGSQFLIGKSINEQDNPKGLLYCALKYGLNDVVKKLTLNIINSHLPQSTKYELLAARREDGAPGLFFALQGGHTDTVSGYCKLIFQSQLDLKIKYELLAAKVDDGVPGLFVALQNGHADTVLGYCKLILQSQLDPKSKYELLAARRENGAPGLFVALWYGHAETVSGYCKLILQSQLDPKSKYELLAARWNETHGLFVALQNEHADTVSGYCKLILQSQLDPKSKYELLEARLHGIPGSFVALQQGHGIA